MRTLLASAFALTALVSTAQQCTTNQYPNILPSGNWTDADLYPDGGVVAASSEGQAFEDVIVKRVDASGTLQWSKLLATTDPLVGLREPNQVIAMPDGGATVFGQTFIYLDQSMNTYFNNYYGIRLDAQGEVVWARYFMYYGTTVTVNQRYTTMMALPNNDVLLALPRATGLNLVRLGADGTPAWERHYEYGGTATANRANKLLVDGNGDMLVCGARDESLFIMRVDANGDVLSMDHYDMNAQFEDMVFAGNGDIMAVQYFGVVRFGPDGSVVWHKQYSGATGFMSIDIAPSGNFFVRGSSAMRYVLIDGNGAAVSSWNGTLPGADVAGIRGDTIHVRGRVNGPPVVPVVVRTWPVNNLSPCIATPTTTTASDAPALVPLGTTVTVQSDAIATWTMSLGDPLEYDQLDLEVSSGSTPARPGFQTICGARVYNTRGRTSGAYDATLTYDPLLSFVSATPAPTSVTSNTITWTGQPGLSGLSYAFFNARFNVPVGATVGTPLTYTFSVVQDSTELTLANNAATVSQVIVNSYDPNDKLVAPEDYYYMDTDSVLTYTIRFQNTGTAPAINVSIRDTLPAEVHASTFRPGASSHPYTYSLTGSGILTFYFDNINLPDSNANEPMSHGFVTFRIKPDETLLPGTEVSNAADIFFDFNDPIRTPDATVVLTISTGLPSGKVERLLAHPVPAREAINVVLPPELVAHSYEIRSADGRVMVTRKVPATTDVLRVPLHPLLPGTYHLMVRDAEGRGAVVRFVKE